MLTSLLTPASLPTTRSWERAAQDPPGGSLLTSEARLTSPQDLVAGWLQTPEVSRPTGCALHYGTVCCRHPGTAQMPVTRVQYEN